MRGHGSHGASQRGSLPPACPTGPFCTLASFSCAWLPVRAVSHLFSPHPQMDLLIPGHTQGHPCRGCCSQGQPCSCRLQNARPSAPGRTLTLPGILWPSASTVLSLASAFPSLPSFSSSFLPSYPHRCLPGCEYLPPLVCAPPSPLPLPQNPISAVPLPFLLWPLALSWTHTEPPSLDLRQEQPLQEKKPTLLALQSSHPEGWEPAGCTERFWTRGRLSPESLSMEGRELSWESRPESVVFCWDVKSWKAQRQDTGSSLGPAALECSSPTF